MIPGTFFEWDDQSEIINLDIVQVRTMPLFAQVFTSDKGEEGWTKLSGQDWFDMYAVNNTVDFSRHGQPLLQTAMAVNAGAEILSKRVVADDAALANIAVIAQVVPGSTSTSPATISYTLKSASGCKTQAEIISAISAAVKADNDAEEAAAEEAGRDPNLFYPLWIFFDNGRGESKKRIRISPNYNLSKNYTNFFMYDLDVLESNSEFDTLHFCLNPDMINNGENISLQYVVHTQSTQIDAYQYSEDIRSFMDAVIAKLPEGTENPEGLDLIFAHDKKGRSISTVVVSDTDVDLSINSGTLLMNGSNGSFGDTPITAENYGLMLAKAFAGYVPQGQRSFKILTAKDGCYDPIIYNVDRYYIDAVMDANYPDVVKRAIEQLVTYREDCFYFRDMGTDKNTIDLILSANDDMMKTKFAGTYCTYYDVINPYSRKQITVTMMYSMAQLVVQQFNNGRNLPMAGIKYGFTITDAIEGTVGFTPTICPGLNQKEDLLDARINYATYIDNALVIESLYTSQEKYSQLSFMNNVIATQEVIKEIRRRCPALRYSFIDGDDLEKYRADVEEVIAPFVSNFKSLTLEYKQDPYYTRNKIFYAVLAVRYRDFVQTEYFKITALSSDTSVDTTSSATV